MVCLILSSDPSLVRSWQLAAGKCVQLMRIIIWHLICPNISPCQLCHSFLQNSLGEGSRDNSITRRPFQSKVKSEAVNAVTIEIICGVKKPQLVVDGNGNTTATLSQNCQKLLSHMNLRFELFLGKRLRICEEIVMQNHFQTLKFLPLFYSANFLS